MTSEGTSVLDFVQSGSPKVPTPQRDEDNHKGCPYSGPRHCSRTANLVGASLVGALDSGLRRNDGSYTNW